MDIFRPIGGIRRHGARFMSWNRDKFIEALAVLFSFLYTLLYIKEQPICWLFALLGASLFVFLCYKKKIFAESGLQLFYVAMAIYGYVNMEADWQLNSWPIFTHVKFLFVGLFGMLAMAWVLRKFTNAKMPLEDSFTTVFSIIATWVMVNYIHENYLYWIVIDAVSIHLYWKREMYFGSILYMVYTAMVTAGYFGLM